MYLMYRVLAKPARTRIKARKGDQIQRKQHSKQEHLLTQTCTKLGSSMQDWGKQQQQRRADQLCEGKETTDEEIYGQKTPKC